MKFFSIAALALVGAVMTSCSSSDDLTENAQQPQPASEIHNYETLTTTVGLDGSETRALDGSGHKTFAVGETMALIYKNTSGNAVKVVSEELKAENIAEGSQSATFTFTLDNPDKTQGVIYIYPAAMATETDPFLNYNALYTEQDGTLTKLASNFDYCLNVVANWSDGNLPSLTLVNDLAILKLTFKNDAGGSDITNSITGLTVSDGSHTYNVTRKTGDGPIYVAIIKTSSATIEVTATDGTKTYAKALSNKSYARSNIYPITWRMAEVIKGKFSVSPTKQVYFSKGNLQATTTDLGAHWTWAFAEHQWDKVGAVAANTSITSNKTVSTNGTVDLFTWSTAETALGISVKTNGNITNTFVEWGEQADVTKNIGTGWRTLTGGQWDYLFNTRTTATGKRHCKAKVGDCFGIILLPDDWSDSYYSTTLQNCNETGSRNFDDNNINNKITIEDWNNSFAPHGVVFLPCAGQRNNGTEVNAPNGQVHYWSATPTGSTNVNAANHMKADGNSVVPNTGAGKQNGFSVRLVRDVK